MTRMGAEPKPTSMASPVNRLRILTVNTHKGFTWMNRRFILPELREAVRTQSSDVVFLQEVLGENIKHGSQYSNWTPVPQYEFLADSMWPDFAYGRNAVYPHGHHGNALLSKFPILRYQNLDVSVSGTEERGLLHAVLDVPGHKEVHVICVHLGLREHHRQEQLGLLSDVVNRLPPGAPVIVAGDFNDWRQRADRYLADAGMHEAFVSEFGTPARSFPARWPLLCLDRIYVRNATFRQPKVLSKRPWSHLSDHVPLAVEVLL